MNSREFIARRVARELHEGDVVNLGIGLPTLVANYVDPNLMLVLQSENGMTGMGPAPRPGEENLDVVNAGGLPSTVMPGGAFFDSAASFAMIRGGHIDVCVLGALQVDEQGNLASWMIPQKTVPGMGGAMDLVVGAKRVIVAMEHTAKGEIKIRKHCTLPLTAAKEVELIVTEMCVLAVTDGGLRLLELNPDFSVEDVRRATEADFEVPDEILEMRV